MTIKDKAVSRRDFMRVGTGLAVARMLGLTPSVGSAEDPARSRVILIRRDDVLGGDGEPVADVLHDMLNEAMRSLFDVSDAGEAWNRLFSADDVVGIKSNVWQRLPTPQGLEEAMRTEVRAVGVGEGDVSVDDRTVLRNPVFNRATAMINVRPLRTHDWSGLGTCIKNVIMFTPRPPEYHDDACASLGALWRLPAIEGKVRLNVLVMLTPQFHSVGPHSFSKEYIWPYYGLIVGVDPVAVDATGARILQAKRNLYFGKESPIAPRPHHIVYADTRYGLGKSDPAKIELVKLGWNEDLLI
jgi:hypothetical protein